MLIDKKYIQEEGDVLLGRRTNKVLWKIIGIADPLK